LLLCKVLQGGAFKQRLLNGACPRRLACERCGEQFHRKRRRCVHQAAWNHESTQDAEGCARVLVPVGPFARRGGGGGFRARGFMAGVCPPPASEADHGAVGRGYAVAGRGYGYRPVTRAAVRRGVDRNVAYHNAWRGAAYGAAAVRAAAAARLLWWELQQRLRVRLLGLPTTVSVLMQLRAARGYRPGSSPDL
jgi:hypothetical protein